ncbi:MAG: oligopeptide transporter, OPT family [Deltaproteobacteria bacterium]|nr:oligopeptide transporter, OPT family [Deltaproteobacteria bacterium]MCW5802713.1 oligopeptide transporter, OPT family [Deltaproteobacteria bacterium]
MADAPSSAPPPTGKVEPYIPASTNLPELTLGVVILGSVLSVILSGANAYLGMFAGLTVSASVPAAVISMAIFRLLRTGNILQNNGVQTAAASGEGLAAGVIFTLPAMLLLKQWTEFNYLETTLIAGFGGILGVLFTIPLRRSLIIDQPLQFPEGIATAEVLKAGAQGGGGVGILALAGAVGALVKIGSSGFQLWHEAVGAARWIVAPSATSQGVPLYFGINASPALLAVGFIVGINVATVIFCGAVLGRWIVIPLYAIFGDPSTVMTPDQTTLASELAKADANGAVALYHGNIVRYLGVGGMLVGGVWSLIKLRNSLLGGIRAGLDAYKRARAGGAGTVLRTERDMPMNIILGLIAASVIPLFLIFWRFTDPGVAAVMAVVMVVAGFLFSAVASYMAGLVGSSNNPVSGITISTILVTSLMLVALGVDSKAGIAAAILMGAIVCCAAAIGGDNLQDLKCGQIVGSTPWKQQVMQIVGVVVAALAMAPILNLLNSAYGIGGKDSVLQAPQANLMANVSKGVFDGGLPWGIVGIGAGIAAVVIIIDSVLVARKSKIRVPVMAFSVGVYLPFDLNVPIFIGGIIAWMVNKALDKENASHERRSTVERNGLLGAAGFITGEALMGIVLAVPVAVFQDANVLRMSPATFIALGFVGFTLWLLYRLAFARDKRDKQ